MIVQVKVDGRVEGYYWHPTVKAAQQHYAFLVRAKTYSCLADVRQVPFGVEIDNWDGKLIEVTQIAKGE